MKSNQLKYKENKMNKQSIVFLVLTAISSAYATTRIEYCGPVTTIIATGVSRDSAKLEATLEIGNVGMPGFSGSVKLTPATFAYLKEVSQKRESNDACVTIDQKGNAVSF